MQARTPKDETAMGREELNQIKSYFRNTNRSKVAGSDSDIVIELVEREIDLRARGGIEHKCTLMFNDKLIVGAGIRDRLKKNAKALAYEFLKTITRNTPRENLILKPTIKKRWKVVIKSTDNE